MLTSNIHLPSNQNLTKPQKANNINESHQNHSSRWMGESKKTKKCPQRSLSPSHSGLHITTITCRHGSVGGRREGSAVESERAVVKPKSSGAAKKNTQSSKGTTGLL